MTLIVGQERNEEGQRVGAATDFQLSRPFLVSSGQSAPGFHEIVMNIGLSCRIVEIIACGSLWQEILKASDTLLPVRLDCKASAACYIAGPDFFFCQRNRVPLERFRQINCSPLWSIRVHFKSA